jgi:hypothetical protein
MCDFILYESLEKFRNYFRTGSAFILVFGTVFAERERERERERESKFSLPGG